MNGGPHKVEKAWDECCTRLGVRLHVDDETVYAVRSPPASFKLVFLLHVAIQFASSNVYDCMARHLAIAPLGGVSSVILS
jgi:hypothetical protein